MKDAYWSPEDDAREAALDAEQLARENDCDQVDIDEAQRFDREERKAAVGRHTPGPWAVSPEDCHRIIVADGVIVNETQQDQVCVARCADDWFDDENYDALAANARLIAAAPMLLEALRACEENLRLVHDAAGPVAKGAPMPSHSTFEAWQLATQAIRAATGGAG